MEGIVLLVPVGGGWGEHDGGVRVLFATAELAPIAAVGGLAQAAAGLGAELRRQGVDVTIVMPDYGGIELAEEESQELAVPPWAGPARVRSGVHAAVGPLSVVEAPGLARSHPYLQPDGHGWPDNDRRFFAFCQAVAAIITTTEPDLVHLNDWHTGATLAAVDGSTPTVLSLHNIAYQGFADGVWLRHLGPRARHYEWFGGTNPLSGAIALADAIVAVSPTHANEILTPEGGFGLDGALRHRWDAVSGILNGIDTTVWDPDTDTALVRNYSAATKVADRVLARVANCASVRTRVGFPDDDVPLAVAIARLTGQKGADLLVPIVPILRSIPLRLVVLGSGEADIAARLAAAAAAHPEWFHFVEGYDDRLAHLLHGAGDVLLMPSRFEPCGLTQMQAMRYGAIPVVTDVGGLHDTVVDADYEADGTGFRAPEATSVAFTSALFRASRHLTNARRRNALSGRGMKLDWSWRGPARQYVELYVRLASQPGPTH
jgi:starch synthase